MNEGQFLDQQRRHAKAAMQATLRKLKHEAIQGVDPRNWARAHPWASVAAAGAAGFTAVNAIGRPPKTQEDRSEQVRQPPAAREHGWAHRLVSVAVEIISFARPMISAMLTAQTAQSHPQYNGRHPQDNPPPLSK
jgi:hypothetical protein